MLSIDVLGADILLKVTEQVLSSCGVSVLALLATCTQFRKLRCFLTGKVLCMSYDSRRSFFVLSHDGNFHTWSGAHELQNKLCVNQVHLTRVYVPQSTWVSGSPSKLRQTLFWGGLGGNSLFGEQEMTLFLIDIATGVSCDPFTFTPVSGASFHNSVHLDAVDHSRLSRNIEHTNVNRVVHTNAGIIVLTPDFVLKLKSKFDSTMKREAYNGPRDNNDFTNYLCIENAIVQKIELSTRAQITMP
jgi:hypothetical protein